MAGTVHISEEEAAKDFPGLLRRVRSGQEIVVEAAGLPVVVMKPAGNGDGPVPAAQIRGKTAEEILRDLDRWEAEHGPLVMDAEFARDLEEIHTSYNQPLDGSKWD